jgi:hypothetical protein
MNNCRNTALSVLTRRRNRTLTDEEAIAWAEATLEIGVDTPLLRELAGADVTGRPNPFEIDRLIECAAIELEVNPKDPQRTYFKELVAAIPEASEPEVRELVIELYNEVLVPLKYPSEFDEWLAVYSELDCEGASQVDGVGWARELANKWLEK